MEGNLKDKIDAIRAILDGIDADVAKSDEGNASAGTRVRNALQDLKKAAQDAKVFCLERDKQRKGK